MGNLKSPSFEAKSIIETIYADPLSMSQGPQGQFDLIRKHILSLTDEAFLYSWIKHYIQITKDRDGWRQYNVSAESVMEARELLILAVQTCWNNDHPTSLRFRSHSSTFD